MRLTTPIGVAIFAIVGFCFAQKPVSPSSPTPPSKPTVVKSEKTAKKSSYKTIEGAVDSVTLADSTKGTRSEIFIMMQMGSTMKHKMSYLVKTTTTLYDSTGKPILLDKIAKGSLVKVKYATTKEGVNEAMSIRVVK